MAGLLRSALVGVTAEAPPPQPQLSAEPLPARVAVPLPPPQLPPPLPDAVLSAFPTAASLARVAASADVPPPAPLVPLPPPLRLGAGAPSSGAAMPCEIPASGCFSELQTAFHRDRAGTLQGLVALLGETRATPHEKLGRLNALIEIGQVAAADVSPYVSLADVVRTLRAYVVSRVRAIRVAALRSFAALNRTRAFALEMARAGVGFFVARSLERECTSRDPDGLERTEALRCVRTIVDVDAGCIPRAVVNALVAIVETPEENDAFCCQCMQTLCEIGALGVGGHTHIFPSLTLVHNYFQRSSTRKSCGSAAG